MSEKPLKTGVERGSLNRHGVEYQWNVAIYEESFEEMIEIVEEAGYSHFSEQVKELASEESPSQCSTVDVRAIEDFFEIRDHGGVIGNINVRLFFGIDHARRTIVTLGTIKKQNNGPTPQPDKVRMRLRWRRYQNGDYGFLGE